MKKHLLIIVSIFISTVNIYAQQKSESDKSLKITKDDYRQLCGFMTGAFSSEAQSKNDTDYYDIRLHMSPIWTDRKEEYWLYVEQAMSSALNKPYRQRFYKVILKDDKTIESIVYTINEPLRFAGAWEKPELLTEMKCWTFYCNRSRPQNLLHRSSISFL